MNFHLKFVLSNRRIANKRTLRLKIPNIGKQKEHN